MTENIFLVGPMGAGKTTIGRQLAKLLNLEFKDADHEIEARTGADIPWIFDVEGEQGFRAREAQVIDDLSKLSNIVLATGGGAILNPSNRQLLRSRGRVVYLFTSITQQLERTKRDRNRPLLQNNDPKAVLTELMSIRDPLYREIADVVVNTDQRRPRTVAIEIVKAFEG